jgi:hypothetical protein
VVQLLERVHVGEEQAERASRLQPLRDRRLERACVRKTGEDVALGEDAELVHHRAVAAREQADQRADADEGDDPDRRAAGEHVGRRDGLVGEDAGDVERRRCEPGNGADSRTGGHRRQGNGEVEEVGEPEPRLFVDDEADEDDGKRGRRADEQELACRGRRRHPTHSHEARHA